jgi:hypothetical protein
MINDFIAKLIPALQQSGYDVFVEPHHIPGVPALIYARSPERYRQAFAKVEDHFAFVDWDQAAFGRLEHFKMIYAALSAFANQGFHVPHAFRMQIPNVALVALSVYGFPPEAVKFARGSSLGPWYGGETGQAMLVDLAARQVTAYRGLVGTRFPERGALPLYRATHILREACQHAF